MLLVAPVVAEVTYEEAGIRDYHRNAVLPGTYQVEGWRPEASGAPSYTGRLELSKAPDSELAARLTVGGLSYSGFGTVHVSGDKVFLAVGFPDRPGHTGVIVYEVRGDELFGSWPVSGGYTTLRAKKRR